MAQHASTAVKMAALAFAAPALLLPMKAAAQQMALGGPTTDEIVAACSKAHQPNQGAIAECIVRRGGEENRRATEENRRATANASRQADLHEQEARCAQDLKAMRTSDPSVVDRGRAILAGRPLAAYGTCNLVKDLTKS